MTGERPKILVVDDVRANLIAMRALLASLKVQLFEAQSGQEALKLALDHRFALALIDVNMPEMDGIELATLLHGAETTATLPIIFVTAASRDDAGRVRAYDAGAVDYIEKPVDKGILLSKVRVFLDLDLKQRQLEHGLARLKEQAEALRVSEARYRAVFDNSAVAICLLNPNGRYVQFNDAWAHLLGYSPEEMFSLTYLDTTHPDDVPISRLFFRRVVSGAIPSYRLEKRYRRRDGAVVWADVSVSVIRAADGSVEAACGLIQDITARRRAEQELNATSRIVEYSRRLEQKSTELEHTTLALRAANDQLRQLDRMKDEFLTSVTHELRTPLTSIKALAEILLDSPDLDGGQRQELLSVVLDESDRLTRLIDQVLDFAKLQAGQVAWSFEAIGPEVIAADAVAAVGRLFHDKGVTLRNHVPAGLPAVTADRDRLGQVLVNLLNNGAKFTPVGGRVELSAEAGTDFVRFEVRDSGPGLAPEDAETVFDRFRQVGDTMTAKPQGAGLGLAICRRVIECHQGRIWVDSRPGRGAAFSFVVPRAASAHGPAPATATATATATPSVPTQPPARGGDG